MQQRAPLYDKAQEGHYNLISALHKSVRGSDPDAALYWLARMLAGGEHPALHRAPRWCAWRSRTSASPIRRRLVQALAAWDAYELLGSPEGELALAQAVIYLATAPKSNAAYMAFGEAKRAAKETGSLMPPMHIRQRADQADEGARLWRGLCLRPRHRGGLLRPRLLPRRLPRQSFYRPIDRGFEREIRKRLEYWEKLRQKKAE